jgi:trehalose 6-phosphate phosphatase
MEAVTLERALAPLIADPPRSGVLLDVDGTLAPIVSDTHSATVPTPTREALGRVANRYGLVACVTGRQCKRAREMVGLSNITYLGNHGSELMRPGSNEVEISPDAAAWQSRIHEFSDRAWKQFELSSLGVAGEDKGAIVGFHWRGAPDEPAAEAVVNEVAAAAQAEGLAVHWAKKILEVRPPIEFSKGSAVRRLLAESDLGAALFAGDDLTDLHAFEALDDAVERGQLDHGVKVGVDSDEAPDGLARSVDVMLDGTDSVRDMLDRLAAA